MSEQRLEQRKNHVYRALNPEQANDETRRLLRMVPHGGRDTRDAIQGLIVLANIGFVSAIHAMSDLMRNGYDRIVDEVLTII